MVMGDFMQFSLVNDLSLYFSILQPMFPFIKPKKKKTMMGKNLWDNSLCLNNIMLTQQPKQAKDVQYSKIFQNTCNIFTKKYYYLL
jgi:high-affinity K+ transport system ATPase subunit B